jgi:geranylgeranyl pyrophosphate synthase
VSSFPAGGPPAGGWTPAAARARLRADRRLVNHWLALDLRFGRDVPARLAAAMRYATIGRAKRLRAVLALESYRAAGGADWRAVRPLCSGIEMIQAFSLVHDDLPCMDDDDFRRGKPSLHRRFDEATAVLAGDALLAFAFELFARSPAAPARAGEALRVMAAAIGPAGMAGGQMLDLGAGGPAGAGRADVNRRKTAVFIAAAVEAGAVLAAAPAPRRRQLRAAGLALGKLFQATDDRLDRAEDDRRPRVPGPAAVDEQAELTRCCRQATRRFAAMGGDYGFLAALPELVLRRRS